MPQHSVQIDPLDSPHPIPWNWVMASISEVSPGGSGGVRYYRSQSLISPDGLFAAYSRIQIHIRSDFFHSRVSSVLFIENLQTGELQVITAASPLSDDPFKSNQTVQPGGTIAILIPVAWSATGDRILAREFESLLGSDIASDYAVVWEQQLNRTSTVAPTRIHYTNAVLLGWSQLNPERILFRAGTIGDEYWPLWSVDLSGQTAAAAAEDKPVSFGHIASNIWSGPQAGYALG